jgi:hypothetical protein
MRQRGNSQVRWLVGVVLLTMAQARGADKATPVDEEFLEYLGTVEDDGDDWTLFEDQQTKPAPETRKPTSKPPEDDAKSASKQK